MNAWLDSRAAMTHVGSKSMKGFYEWCRRHHIVRRSNGTIARADLDRVLRRASVRGRHRAPASLANLRQRQTATGA